MTLRLVGTPVHAFFLDTKKGGPSSYTWAVAVWLLVHVTEESGSFEATMLDVAQGTDFSRSTVQRAITELIDLGALTRRGAGPRLSSRYDWSAKTLAEWRALTRPKRPKRPKLARVAGGQR